MRYLLFSASIFLLASCAQIGNPSGGPKDEAPPKIKKAIPDIGSTNFEGDEVRLQFDEFIVLNQLNQEAIVSPPSENEPEYKVNNKTLIISFKDELLPNTTYTINLGNGVKDFHEGVILDSNVVVFSTGDYIDSLKFSGTLKNAFDLEPVDKALVLLFEETGDSVPSLQRPYYYTKTNEQGEFSFNYLKAGKFSIFTLLDQNNNRLYDLPNEPIGFLLDRIDTENPDSSLTLKLFEPDNKKQFVVSLKEVEPGLIQLILNRNANEVSIDILGRTFKKPWYVSDTTLQGDTLSLWTNIGEDKDSTLSFKISADGEILDTVNLKLNPVDTSKLPKPTLELNTNSGYAKYFESLILTSNSPILSFNKNAKLKVGESDTLNVNLIQVGSKKLKLDFKLEQESKYELLLPDSLVKNTLGYFSEFMSFKFKTRSDIEYANLELKVELPPITGNAIIQLMSKGSYIFREDILSKDSTLSYPNLSPGEYKIKLIFDENKDGKWTTGKYIPRTLPERVIFYSEPLEMKEGWDKNITWTIPE